MKVNALIVDDEALARQRLVNLINDVPEISIIGECSNGKDAIKSIEKLKPLVIFLDIQMKDMNGFDVLQKIKLNVKPIVVFVTAYNEFALKAFDFFAFDYLLKPYKDSRFYKSIENVLTYIKNNNYEHYNTKLDQLITFINNEQVDNTNYITKLPIKLGNKVSFINTPSIKYIIASGYYAEIFTNEKKYLLRESLNSLIESLNPENFIRIHRSTIININEIIELVNSSYGEVDVKMIDNKLFRVSKSYKKQFLKKMGL